MNGQRSVPNIYISDFTPYNVSLYYKSQPRSAPTLWGLPAAQIKCGFAQFLEMRKPSRKPRKIDLSVEFASGNFFRTSVLDGPWVPWVRAFTTEYFTRLHWKSSIARGKPVDERNCGAYKRSANEISMKLWDTPFSSLEAALLLVSTKNHDLSGQVQRHSGFEWLCKHNIETRTNQICQTWLWECAEWREVRESRISGVGPSQRPEVCQRSRFLVLTKRSAASGDETNFWVADRNRKWAIFLF